MTPCATSSGGRSGAPSRRACAWSRAKTFFAEYLGLDYACALDLHLYHYAFRDVVSWAMASGYKSFRSPGLNYDPKLHLRGYGSTRSTSTSAMARRW